MVPTRFGLKSVKQYSNYHLIMLALDWTRNGDPPMSLGHASILSSLKQACINKHLLTKQYISSIEIGVNDPKYQCNPEIISASIIKQINKIKYTNKMVFNTHIDLGVGVFIWNELIVQQLLKSLLASNNNTMVDRIILGGPQITYGNSDKLSDLYTNADIFIKGYAEDAMTRVFINKLENKDDGDLLLTRGVILNTNKYYQANNVSVNNDDIASTSLNKIPSPFLNDIIQLNDQHRFIRWETQRGCPFKCSFCQHPGIPGILKNNHDMVSSYDRY